MIQTAVTAVTGMFKDGWPMSLGGGTFFRRSSPEMRQLHDRLKRKVPDGLRVNERVSGNTIYGPTDLVQGPDGSLAMVVSKQGGEGFKMVINSNGRIFYREYFRNTQGRLEAKKSTKSAHDVKALGFNCAASFKVD